MTITYNCPECDCPIDYDFTPSRPAPFCQNHDSPAFSDSGDAAVLEGPEECPQCHVEIDQDKVIEQAESHVSDQHE